MQPQFLTRRRVAEHITQSICIVNTAEDFSYFGGNSRQTNPADNSDRSVILNFMHSHS